MNPRQVIGKLHHYRDPQLNTELDRLYNFLSVAAFPDNSVEGRKLKDGSVPVRKLIQPISPDSIGSPIAKAYAHIRDEKTNGTNGGDFDSGAWRTRDLNTVVSDEEGIVSLDSSQITLQVGEYVIRAKVPASQVTGHQARLRDIISGDTILTGTNAYSASSGTSDSSIIVGRFSVVAPTEFEIQHACASTKSSTGFGRAIAIFESNAEIYTEVEIWQID